MKMMKQSVLIIASCYFTYFLLTVSGFPQNCPCSRKHFQTFFSSPIENPTKSLGQRDRQFQLGNSHSYPRRTIRAIDSNEQILKPAEEKPLNSSKNLQVLTEKNLNDSKVDEVNSTKDIVSYEVDDEEDNDDDMDYIIYFEPDSISVKDPKTKRELNPEEVLHPSLIEYLRKQFSSFGKSNDQKNSNETINKTEKQIKMEPSTSERN